MSDLAKICQELSIDLTKGCFVANGNNLATMPYDLQSNVILLDCTDNQLLEVLLQRYEERQKIWLEASNRLGDWSEISIEEFKAQVVEKNLVMTNGIGRSKAQTNLTYCLVIKLERDNANVQETNPSQSENISITNGKSYFSLEPLSEVVKTLRAPNGCPWDKLQTHSSLRRYFLEEVYEVLEAIDKKDIVNLREELGDVLLQVVFHARLAEERGDFSVQDVINDVTEKMIYRHPKVFPEANSRELGDALLTWEALKIKEKGNLRKNLLAGVSKGLPALLRAQKLQEKAGKVGFDWNDINPVWDKFYEEIDEFKVAIDEKNIKNIEIEGGDVLFSLINILRWYKISGENALSRTNTKFQQRFTYVEEQVEKSKKSWKDFSLAELDEFWKAAKLQESENSY